jgi:hypothetical protein
MSNVSIHEAARQVGVSHVALINARKRGAWQAEPDGTVNMERLYGSDWARRRIDAGKLVRPVAPVPAAVAAPVLPELSTPLPAAVTAPVAPLAPVAQESPLAEQLAARLFEMQPRDLELFAEADPANMAEVLNRSKHDIEKLKMAEDWRRKRLDNDEREKKLVPSDVVESAVEGRFREDAEALLNWPSRVSAEMAAELGVEDRLMAVVLEKYVRDFMELRSKCPAGLAA